MIDLRHGDCLEVMRDIPDGSVDLVLCDLPYGVTKNEWDSAIPFEALWDSYRRVCKKNAAVVLFGQMPFTAKLVMSNINNYRYSYVWNKKVKTGFLNANVQPLRHLEDICVFYKQKCTYNAIMTKGIARDKGGGSMSSNYGIFRVLKKYKSDMYYPSQLLEFLSPDRAKRLHPTQKPVALLEYLIKTYTDAGETVLDNTMGSGSTGVACVNTGRSFIGIEKDDRYFEIARKRIEDAERERKGSLFDMDALDAETERRERESWLFEEEE